MGGWVGGCGWVGVCVCVQARPPAQRAGFYFYLCPTYSGLIIIGFQARGPVRTNCPSTSTLNRRWTVYLRLTVHLRFRGERNDIQHVLAQQLVHLTGFAVIVRGSRLAYKGVTTLLKSQIGPTSFESVRCRAPATYVADPAEAPLGACSKKRNPSFHYICKHS